jgi:cytochrome c553
MNKRTLVLVAALAALAFPVLAGEWHSSDASTNLCTDCHTMHFSQTHNWDGSTPVPTTPAPNGNWLGATGPNAFLLKAPANELCLACHDGQTFAPDVLEINTNAASQIHGRSAGALNRTGATPYEMWKGHTLDSTATPPGYNPATIGSTYTYTPANGLECTSCHTQHGRAAAYRNLGPRYGSGTTYMVTYKFSTTPGDFGLPCRNSTATSGTCDVRLDMASYTSNSGAPATFAPYYDTSEVFYGRNDIVQGPNDTSNKIDTMCAFCHGNFHGGPGDTNMQMPSIPDFEEWLRHPTSATTIGTLGGGHSALTRYTSANTKVKTYATQADYSDASPGCITCHKGHGNQNPFGLVFLNRNSVTPTEQGGWSATQTPDPPGQYIQGYRNLCGQCHGQGNS